MTEAKTINFWGWLLSLSNSMEWALIGSIIGVMTLIGISIAVFFFRANKLKIKLGNTELEGSDTDVKTDAK
jgi:uncharacterized membrane protein